MLDEITHSRSQKTNHLSILDSIYESQQKKVKFEVHKRRLKIKQGTLKGITQAEERNQEIEKRCAEELLNEREEENKNDVAQIRNKLMMFDEAKATGEKLKGRFDLRINSGLKMPKKICKFAYDPIAFHLHKNRQFMRKL